MPPKYTREQLIEFGAGREPDPQVAAYLGVTKQRVHALRRQHGISAPGEHMSTPATQLLETINTFVEATHGFTDILYEAAAAGEPIEVILPKLEARIFPYFKDAALGEFEKATIRLQVMNLLFVLGFTPATAEAPPAQTP